MQLRTGLFPWYRTASTASILSCGSELWRAGSKLVLRLSVGGWLSDTMYNGVDWGGTATSSVTVDNRTGLMWVSNTNDTCTGCSWGYVSSGTYNWANALARCEGLTYAGFSDWRLPNAKELFSIVKEAGSEPLIDQSAFPIAGSGYYWTSTTYVQITTYALLVLSGDRVDVDDKTVDNYVRCVRASP